MSVLIACIAMVVGFAPAASAAYAAEPVGPSWVPDGGVHATVADGDRVYVGGSFTGGVAALTADTGQLIWRGNANGDVRALALGPDGRLLLGGAFTAVGGYTHRKLAAVYADTGVVDNTFKGAAGGTVRDIVVVGGTAYFGGAFLSHGGMTQRGLGAVNARTGALVTAFTAATNGTVYSLGTDGSRLFIGGTFTTVDGWSRDTLASVTLSTNKLDLWAPVRACSDCNVIWDLTVDPTRNRVYAAGRNAGGLYILDSVTGATIYRLGGFNGDTQALTLAPDGKIYVGGHFVTVTGGVSRMLVAEFDVSGTKPVLGAFSTRFVTTWPGVWAMDSTSGRLYVGGDFTAAGPQVNGKNKYPYFAMFPAGTGSTIDTTAPTVTTRSPAAGATGVATSANVTATFSEPVQGVAGNFTLTAGGTAVSATVSQVPGSNQWVLDPAADLAASTVYTATLTGGSAAIRDGVGNPLVSTSWTFTTASAPSDTTAPTVTARSPVAGATGVATSANVTATFSEPVQGVAGNFTLTAGGTAVAATVSQVPGSNQWVLDPAAELAAGTVYTVTLTGGSAAIRDSVGNPLVSTSWTFTTASAPSDTTAPTVTERSPVAGATGVAISANVTATFSEPVQGVAGNFTLSAGGTAVSATVSQVPGSNQWVLDPAAELAAGTVYTATLTGGSAAIRDSVGNPLVTTSWTFTTASATGDTTAPTWTGRLPTHGKTGISRTTNVTIAFSEEVQGVTTTTFTLAPSAGGDTVAGTVSFSTTSGRWVLNPSSSLAANTQYTATVTDAVTDMSGNAFAGTTWSFTTGA